MDLGKALATMGFGTARLDDVHGKRDAQDELNVSLTRLMENHEKKKKKLMETEKIELKRSQMADKLRNEVRTVHEAYQFLSRKYQIDKERLKEKEKEIQVLQLNNCEATNETNGLIIIDDDMKKEGTFGMGSAVSLKAAANAFKDNIEGGGKETSYKVPKRSIRGKIDSNDERSDIHNPNTTDVPD